MSKPYREMRWRPELPDPAACLLLSRAHGILPVTAQILYNRGLTTPEAAGTFLAAGRAQMHDPFLLKDMERAVALIRARLNERRPIMVYGDYDVDGVTGTTILVLALRALGAEVESYIPDRFAEGYGLNAAAVAEIGRRGFDFILSVDTGTTAVKEAEVARSLGITLVVSDHHEPGPELPEVGALVNPKRADCQYPFKGLSGVGVAFKLALALGAPNAWDLLDIVTLGTIADMVPLVGENRAIVREGLAALGATRRPGLRALMEVASVREPVTATHIGFALGPRINALGRMGSAMAGVELLTTADPVRGLQLARHLDEENRNRQAVEGAIFQEALAQAEQMAPEERSHVLVLAGEGWHHGVVGICAAKVLRAYHRPTVLLSIDGDEVRGSARSIPAFHMHQALLQLSDLFVKFGGHAAAAGMTLRSRADIPVFRERLNRLAARWLRPEDLVPQLAVDARIRLSDLTDRLIAELQALEPHGVGNPEPVLAATGVSVTDARTMGREQQHLRVSVTAKDAPAPFDAVGWSMAAARPQPRQQVDIAFRPELDTYQGRVRLRLTLRDLQPQAALPPDPLTAAHCLAWDPLAGLGAPAGRAPAAVIDARDAALAEALEGLNAPLPEVAAAAPEGGAQVEAEAEAAAPEATRLLYLAALAAPAESRVLVLTATPWAAAALAEQVGHSRPDLREAVRWWGSGEPEPAGGRLVITAYGARPAGPYTDTALYHPPYHEGQIEGDRVHLLWERADWGRAEAALGWAYPDREVLVQFYKLLRAGQVTADGLAAATGEVAGSWTEARLAAGLKIFREIDMLAADGRLNGGRFELESSTHFRRGQAGRAALAALAALADSHAKDWPTKSYAI